MAKTRSKTDTPSTESLFITGVAAAVLKIMEDHGSKLDASDKSELGWARLTLLLLARRVDNVTRIVDTAKKAKLKPRRRRS